MADLSGVLAKLDRATDHLASLETSIRLWTNSNPYTFTNARNPEKTEVRFHVKITIQPATLRWGLFIGDCVHNLRSALDHLIWECSEASLRSARTEFPIFKDKSKFIADQGQKKINGIKDPAQRAIIERYQPWQNPLGADNDSLWLIHEFDRTDKHQVLTPVLVVPQTFQPDIVTEYATEEIAARAGPPFVEISSNPVQDGAEAMVLRFAAPFERVEMKTQVTAAVAIEYGGNFGGPIGTLGMLCEHARRIVEDFRNTI